ncbi:MAG: hypothetical protein Kow0069_06090 [Promethearchaeota archaeon]
MDGPVEWQTFRVLVGRHVEALRALLTVYANAPPTTPPAAKLEMPARQSYYRQVCHHLVFLVRFPAALEVPGHSEVVQARDQLFGRERLLAELYRPMARQRASLMSGNFRSELERLVGKERGRHSGQIRDPPAENARDRDGAKS